MVKYGPEGPEQWTKFEKKEDLNYGKMISDVAIVAGIGFFAYKFIESNKDPVSRQINEIKRKITSDPLFAAEIAVGGINNLVKRFFHGLIVPEQRKQKIWRQISEPIDSAPNNMARVKEEKNKTHEAHERAKNTTKEVAVTIADEAGRVIASYRDRSKTPEGKSRHFLDVVGDIAVDAFNERYRR